MAGLVQSPRMVIAGALPTRSAGIAPANRVQMNIPALPTMAAPAPRQPAAPDLSALLKILAQKKSAPETVAVTPQVTQSGGFLGGVGNSGTFGLKGNGGALERLMSLFGG